MNRVLKWLTLGLVAALAFGLAAPAEAYIIWVSDGTDVEPGDPTPPPDGVPNDQGFVDLLTGAGYTVERRDGTLQGDLEPAEVAELNAAQLVIVSRDTNSGAYNKPAQWNGITAPIMLTSAYLARSSRWKWLNTGSIADTDPAPLLEAVDPSDPVFDNVTLDPSSQIGILESVSTFATSTSAGNGTLVAKAVGTDHVWIARWDAGTEFYSGAGQTPAAARMLFIAGQAGGSNTPEIGVENLNADGEQVFLDAVGSIAIPEPGTLLLLVMAGLGLLIWWRR